MNMTVKTTGLIIIIASAFILLACVTSSFFGKRVGYEAACRDFYQGHLKMDLVENKDGTKEWKWLNKDSKETPAYSAWDDKNYFEGDKPSVIEQLDRWNGEDYYEVKRLSCPKCGSYRIMPDHARDRGVILGYRCKDCGYIWRRK